jgi:hypothetical protein
LLCVNNKKCWLQGRAQRKRARQSASYHRTVQIFRDKHRRKISVFLVRCLGKR